MDNTKLYFLVHLQMQNTYRAGFFSLRLCPIIGDVSSKARHLVTYFSSGVVEERLHRAHVHPQFLEEGTKISSENFPLFDMEAIMHPQFITPCSIPVLCKTCTLWTVNDVII